MKSVGYVARLLSYCIVGFVFHCYSFFVYNENTNYWQWVKQYFHSYKLVFAWCSSYFYNTSFHFLLVIKVSLLLI